MNIYTFADKLEKIDLQLVADKLMSSEYGYGWNIEKTQLAIKRYKKFLTLQYLYPNFELVPSKEIDAVWHEHILVNTYQYIQDCHYLFGYLLHHRWTDSKKDIVESQKVRRAFITTKQLFMVIFAEDIFGETNFEAAPCVDLPISSEASLQIGACVNLPKYSFSDDASSYENFQILS